MCVLLVSTLVFDILLKMVMTAKFFAVFLMDQ